MAMNICRWRPLQIDVFPTVAKHLLYDFENRSGLVDFTGNPHYTGYRVTAYASVIFNFPVVFLKGTLPFRVPFTIFLEKEIEHGLWNDRQN